MRELPEKRCSVKYLREPEKELLGKIPQRRPGNELLSKIPQRMPGKELLSITPQRTSGNKVAVIAFPDSTVCRSDLVQITLS